MLIRHLCHLTDYRFLTSFGLVPACTHAICKYAYPPTHTHTQFLQDYLPDDLLLVVMGFLPSLSYLPVANVSQRFRIAWRKTIRQRLVATGAFRSIPQGLLPSLGLMTATTTITQHDNTTDPSKHKDEQAISVQQAMERLDRATRRTDPLHIGNVFGRPWYLTSRLSTTLLDYYIHCGWPIEKYSKRLARETLARGDLIGLRFLASRQLCVFDDEDYCEVAAAAGHLDALKWLREEQQCPWDPSEVHKEASENLHTPVMLYVELTSRQRIEISYGEGMPW